MAGSFQVAAHFRPNGGELGFQQGVSAGGRCEREPLWEDGEPPHLAMCEDTEGNQFMLSRQRS